MISSQTVHWVAGLLEGEGCFLTTKQGAPKIALNMTDEDVVRRFAELVRCNARERKSVHRTNPELKRQFACEVISTKAVAWMMTILPLMGRRRGAKIREVLADWRARPKTHRIRGERQCVRGHDLTPQNTTPQDLCRTCKQEYERAYYRGYRRYGHRKIA